MGEDNKTTSTAGRERQIGLKHLHGEQQSFCDTSSMHALLLGSGWLARLPQAAAVSHTAAVDHSSHLTPYSCSPTTTQCTEKEITAFAPCMHPGVPGLKEGSVCQLKCSAAHMFCQRSQPQKMQPSGANAMACKAAGPRHNTKHRWAHSACNMVPRSQPPLIPESCRSPALGRSP